MRIILHPSDDLQRRIALVEGCPVGAGHDEILL